MILAHERAAGGEIAAGKGLGEWPPEGKPNGDNDCLVGATEQTLRKQCQHMMVCVEWASFGRQAGWHRKRIFKLLSQQK